MAAAAARRETIVKALRYNMAIAAAAMLAAVSVAGLPALAQDEPDHIRGRIMEIGDGGGSIVVETRDGAAVRLVTPEAHPSEFFTELAKCRYSSASNAVYLVEIRDLRVLARFLRPFHREIDPRRRRVASRRVAWSTKGPKMKFKQLHTAFALAPLFLVGLSTWADAANRTTRPAAGDHVVARIDGTEIRRSDLIFAQQLMPKQYRDVPLEAIYPFLMKHVINNILVVHAARSEGIHKTEPVRRRLEAIERRLVEGAYLERATEGKVTDQALRERYRVMTESLRGSEEVRVRHILLDQKRQAVSVIKELADGADFARLARQKSAGPSKAQGGDLGYLTREAMVKPFADAAFGLTIGQVTPIPVETQFGWHVIKLEDRRAAKLSTFGQMRPQLVRWMRARIANEIVRKLRRNARIEEFDLNGNPKSVSPSQSMSTGNR